MFPRIRHTALFLLLAGTAQAAPLADWAKHPVPIKPGDKPDIAAFALPLAQTFDDLGHCVPGFEDSKGDGDGASIHIDSKNGFASCESGDGHQSEYAYWKRANGHYLVGMTVTWNDVSWEGDEMKNLVHFYDFDPKAADPALTPEEEISRAVNAFHDKDYFIHLPPSGTHLVLQQFEGAGGATHYLAWDGERFADTPLTSLPKVEKPADKGKKEAKKAAPAKAKADDKGKAKDKPRDKPEAVYAIGQAYRAGKQLAEKDATRMFLDIRNVWHSSPETTRKIEYLFAEEARAPYLIYVHHEGMGTLSYEEYLADKDGGLLFWFQKLEDDSGKWEYRLYFDGGKVVYHDIRKDGGKPQTGTGLPKKHPFGAGEGGLSMQRSFQALMTAFEAQMPTH